MLWGGTVTEPEPYATAAFAFAGPSHLLVNPNRLYPVDEAILARGAFALSWLARSQRDVMLALIGARRREPDKVRALGLAVEAGPLDLPALAGAPRTAFCTLERWLDTGDHRLLIGRVVELRTDAARLAEPPLLYADVTAAPSVAPRLERLARRALVATGALDAWRRRRGVVARPRSLPEETYLDGGQTEAELATLLAPGVRDLGRRLAPPASPPPVPPAPLGVCVVGPGGWGAVHAQLVRAVHPAARLYVCGRDAARTEAFARRAGAAGWFTDLAAAAADPAVQALTLALPHDVHRAAIEALAAARKPVLLEKPIATTLADADAILAAEVAGLPLMVAEDMHWRPAIATAARLVAQGAIGEPLYADMVAGGHLRPSGWKADVARMGGGVWLDVGVHYVRALRLLLGEPTRVLAARAMTVNTKMGGEDSARVLFASEAGWQAQLLTSWVTGRFDLPDITLFGERGTLCCWPRRRWVELHTTAPTALGRLAAVARPAALREWLLGLPLGRRRIPLDDPDPTGYAAEFRAFLGGVARGALPAGNARAARRDLELVLAGYDALRDGGWVPVPPDAG
ncbi:MAG: Gfo/Idh/MocA family oxidoreductase [Gemmatimonadales bacterium]|nr:Gfo/Idh/MocA family oxidoreductase [Gemmatimonadales bacterium]